MATETIPDDFLARYGHRAGDEWTREENRKAGHTLCANCGGTGNEMHSMYRSCSECSSGIAVEYGELTALGRWWAERRDDRERKRLNRKYASPRDWRMEIAWRASRWLGIGHCFHGFKDECSVCHAPAGDIDFNLERVGPFRSVCLDRGACKEAFDEMHREESH